MVWAGRRLIRREVSGWVQPHTVLSSFGADETVHEVGGSRSYLGRAGSSRAWASRSPPLQELLWWLLCWGRFVLFCFLFNSFSCGNNLRQDPVPFEVGIGNSEWPGCQVVLRVISLDDNYVVRALRKPLSVRDA